MIIAHKTVSSESPGHADRGLYLYYEREINDIAIRKSSFHSEDLIPMKCLTASLTRLCESSEVKSKQYIIRESYLYDCEDSRGYSL